MTTRTVDSEYLKKNPGTFAVDNGNGSYSGTSNRSGGNGYETPPVKKPARNQWLDIVVQTVKPFKEWLATDGKFFKYNNDTKQNTEYRKYVEAQASAGKLTEDEYLEFCSRINEMNS